MKAVFVETRSFTKLINEYFAGWGPLQPSTGGRKESDEEAYL